MYFCPKLAFFKVVWKLFKNCLGVIFGLIRLIVECSICPKNFLMSTKTRFFGEIMSFDMVILTNFDNLYGKKRRVFLLFKSCFGIVNKLFGEYSWP